MWQAHLQELFPKFCKWIDNRPLRRLRERLVDAPGHPAIGLAKLCSAYDEISAAALTISGATGAKAEIVELYPVPLRSERHHSVFVRLSRIDVIVNSRLPIEGDTD